VSDSAEEGRGLQAERTVLAHWRTDLAAVVVAMLVVRQATPGTERLVVLVLAVGSVAIVTAAGLLRQRRLLAGGADAAPWTVATIAAAVAVLQAAALAVVL